GPWIPGLRQMINELDVLDIACLQWRMCVERACMFGRSLPPDRYMEFRLEDFGSEMLDRMLEFCELPPSPEVRAYFDANFEPQKPDGRLKKVDRRDVDRILEWLAPTMHWLGQEIPAPATQQV